MRRRRSVAGFTLIELLVVIAIIGVLIAPCCLPSRRPAKRRGGPNAKTTSKQIGLALHNFLT